MGDTLNRRQVGLLVDAIIRTADTSTISSAADVVARHLSSIELNPKEAQIKNAIPSSTPSQKMVLLLELQKSFRNSWVAPASER
tara:strand:+ start:6842 stop:7093 length:252 start_codon:yes stop_codon:yes gene_type:complete